MDCTIGREFHPAPKTFPYELLLSIIVYLPPFVNTKYEKPDSRGGADGKDTPKSRFTRAVKFGTI